MPSQLHFHIDTREPFADGRPFGNTGPYERIIGRAEVVLDPESPHYQDIVDLHLAPQDAQGRIRYQTDVYLLKPLDVTRGNRRLFYDVFNRGDKRALQFFNDAASNNAPMTSPDAGNGFLFNEGYTVLWCGWQADVVPGDARATLTVPIACGTKTKITGAVREEIIVDEPGITSMPLSGKSTTRSHPTSSLDTRAASLTYRQFESDPHIAVPSSEWMFAHLADDGSVTPSPTNIYIPAQFRPGWIYEVIYEAQDPQILGLGFAAVRDLVDFFRQKKTDASGTVNPLTDINDVIAIERAYAWGRSQSGRFLREFVYRGWNVGQSGQQIFDAVWPHVTGAGRLALNLRFAHPDRFPRQHEQHLYPSDQFPFAYVQSTDPWSGQSDALLRRVESDPFVIHTQTSSEYWQRRGSLAHTDAFGVDLPEHPRVRMYLFASSQHHSAPGVPSHAGPHRHPSNPLNTSPLLRALLIRLDAWVTHGELPPASAVPRRRDGTLVNATQAMDKFPAIGNIRPPRQANRLHNQDYGSQYDRGITTLNPPEVHETQEYAVLVPLTDCDGNELPGLRTPDIEVPRATYTGWNHRAGNMEPGTMYSIVGSFFPFAPSEAVRKAACDERPSISERYRSPADYVRRVAIAAEALNRQGFLLPEDVDRYVAAAISLSGSLKYPVS